MLQAADGLCSFYARYGRYEEGAQMCRIAVERLSVSPSSTGAAVHQRALAKVLAWHGVYGYLLGKNDQADGLLRQSLDILEGALVDWPGQVETTLKPLGDVQAEKTFATWYLGKVVYDVDRIQAKPLYEQSLAMYRALNDRWGIANALEELGWIARHEGDCERARRLGEEAFALRRALDDPQAVSRSLMQLSTIAYRQGRLEEAEALIRDRCTVSFAGQSQAERADALGGSGWILTRLGQFAEGHRRMVESVAIWKDLGIPRMVAYRSIPLGFAKLHLGEVDEASALTEAGLDVARETDDAGKMGFAQLIRGWVALAQGAYLEALERLQKSSDLSRAVVARDQVGEVFALQAYAARGLGQPLQAQRHLRAAIQVTDGLERFWPLLLALPVVALLRADEGEVEQAVELYGLASRYRYVADSRWFEGVVGQHIAAAAAKLPLDIVTAAKERGSKLNLQATVGKLLDEMRS
jgi:tetratricopeptide (TPR) repeat protein